MARGFREVLVLTSSLVPFALGQALANPVGGNVVGGSASIAGDGSARLEVHQTSDKAIIDWRSFDIAPGEVTHFVQPGIDSVTLNRIVGGLGASAIDGTLLANGKVFLVNPDGIAFGMGALIDTAGLVATTSDIANADFMVGHYAFARPGRADASVVNLGMITAESGGFAALVAPGVRNAGVIAADLGQVALASGNGFTLDFYGDQLITLSVGDEIAGEVRDAATGETLDALVKNEGTIRASGGTVHLSAATARKVVDSVINNTGVVEANSVGVRNGKIVLGARTVSTKSAGAPSQKVKVSGTLSASGKNAGETGGKIQITGEEITLTAATIDASGNVGGGTVLIGGDVGGGNPNPDLVKHERVKVEATQVATATTTAIDADSRIDASAIVDGDGGKAVVWADGDTAFTGTIYAGGGAQSGDGGFAEVSGKERLLYDGTADLASPNGHSGTLLLDPRDVYIGSSGAWYITPTAIQAALATNEFVFITNAGTPGPDAGDIVIGESIAWTGTSLLHIGAHRNIVVKNGATIKHTGGNSGQFTMTLFAGQTNVDANIGPAGEGIVRFEGSGKIDWSQSDGSLNILYVPPGGYANDIDYSPHILGSFFSFMVVSDVFDLQNISQNLSGSYIVQNDIDASVTATWNGGAGFIPVGTASNPFTGVLTAGLPSRTIRNLTINSSAAAVGLIGVANCCVLDLNLQNANIRGTANNAAVGGLVGVNWGSVQNIVPDNRISVSGTITATGQNSSVGGVVGVNHGFVSAISSAVVSGNNSTFGGQAGVGGVVGYNSGQVDESNATGAISANGGPVGGLVGRNSGGNVSDSYARGSVRGGIAGGLVGVIEQGGSISRSYSTGAVTGSGPLGGLVGSVGSGGASVSSSYWDTQTSGRATSAAGTPRTTLQLTSGLPSGFSGSEWAINSTNSGYPHLRSTAATGIPPSLIQLHPRSGLPPDVTGGPQVAAISEEDVVGGFVERFDRGGSFKVDDSEILALASQLGLRTDFVVDSEGYVHVAGQTELLQQCVALVKALTGISTATREWTAVETDRVAKRLPDGSWESNSRLEPGAAVATFSWSQEGKRLTYTKAHAAVFLGYHYDSTGNLDGMYVLDQFNLAEVPELERGEANSGGAQVRVISFSDNHAYYSTKG